MAKILCVHPDKEIPRLKDIFDALELDVTFVQTGEFALEEALEVDYDAAYVDSELEDVSGREFAELLCDELNFPVFFMAAVSAHFAEQTLSKFQAVYKQPFVYDTIKKDLVALLALESDEIGAPLNLEGVEQNRTFEPMKSNTIDSLKDEMPLDSFDDISIDQTSFVEDCSENEHDLLELGKVSGLLEKGVFEPLLVRKQASIPIATPASVAVQQDDLLEVKSDPETLISQLTAFYSAHTTGELLLENSTGKRLFLFVNGRIVGIRTSFQREAFAYCCLEKKVCSKEDIIEWRAKQKFGMQKTLIDFLSVEKNVGLEKIMPALFRSMQKVIRQSFTASDAVIKVSKKGLGNFEKIPLNVSAAEVILRGVRYTQTFRDLNQNLQTDVRFAENNHLPYLWEELGISEAELQIAQSFDGTKTLDDISVLFYDIPMLKLKEFCTSLHQIGMLSIIGHGLYKARKIHFF